MIKTVLKRCVVLSMGIMLAIGMLAGFGFVLPKEASRVSALADEVEVDMSIFDSAQGYIVSGIPTGQFYMFGLPEGDFKYHYDNAGSSFFATAKSLQNGVLTGSYLSGGGSYNPTITVYKGIATSASQTEHIIGTFTVLIAKVNGSYEISAIETARINVPQQIIGSHYYVRLPDNIVIQNTEINFSHSGGTYAYYFAYSTLIGFSGGVDLHFDMRYGNHYYSSLAREDMVGKTVRTYVRYTTDKVLAGNLRLPRMSTIIPPAITTSSDNESFFLTQADNWAKLYIMTQDADGKKYCAHPSVDGIVNGATAESYDGYNVGDTIYTISGGTINNTIVWDTTPVKGYMQILDLDELDHGDNVNITVEKLELRQGSNTVTWKKIDSASVTYTHRVVGEAPKKEGHSFVAWYYDAELTQIYAGAPIDAQTVLHPKYVPNQYTVQFAGNGGSFVAPVIQDFGTKIAEPTIFREHYTLVGWYLDAGLSQKVNLAAWTIPAKDVVLWAKWTLVTYHVKIMVGGTLHATLDVAHGTTLRQAIADAELDVVIDTDTVDMDAQIISALTINATLPIAEPDDTDDTDDTDDIDDTDDVAWYTQIGDEIKAWIEGKDSVQLSGGAILALIIVGACVWLCIRKR